jgi:hypothetical protein
MTIEEQIAELLAKAAPLRLLPDDQAEEKGLPGIVGQINALRALPPGEEAPKRGRPRKAE